MSVTKSWAYVTEFGRERITAWAISRERAKYDGKPLGKTYWSNHKPGQRKPVKQVQKAGTTFFAYINPTDADGGGDGESLSHRLLKEAIAGLAGTKLKLGIYGEHDVTITHGETEKLMPTKEGTYYADAYLRFTCSTRLALRWSGELYVEVHNRHAVPVDKQKELQRSRIPVVEVPLLKTFEYPYPDEDTSDPREAVHLERIRDMIEKGFLEGQVISDRLSVEFLEQEVTRLSAGLRDARNGWDVEKEAAANVAVQLTLACARATELEKLRADDARAAELSSGQLNGLQHELDAEKEKAGALRGELGKATATIERQRKKMRRYQIAGSVLTVLSLVGVLGYRYLSNPSSVSQDISLSAQPTTILPVAQSADARVPSIRAKHAAHKAVSRRHLAPISAPVVGDGDLDGAAQ
jgi:hypothetical protein